MTRIVDIDHRESILFVGQNHKSLCPPGEALVVNRFDPQLAEVLVVAGKLLIENLEKYGIAPNGKILLITAASYSSEDDPGITEVRKKFAKLKAEKLANRSAGALRDRRIEKLLPYVDYMTAIVDTQTFLAETFG
jgi:hypothetical protein